MLFCSFVGYVATIFFGHGIAGGSFSIIVGLLILF